MFEDIREALPRIPEEVARLWILPLAEREGWPPSNANRWDTRITGEAFSFWNDAEWEKTVLDLSQLPFSRGYRDTMTGLQDAYLSGVENAYWQLLGEDGKHRFRSCFNYILSNRVFPQPPVLSPNEVGHYDVLDGNHRFLAYELVLNAHAEYVNASDADKRRLEASLPNGAFQEPHASQEVWVCRPNWNNSERAQNRIYLRERGMDIF